MTKKEKHAAYLGITLFLLAAIFSISLILGLLDFGHSKNIFYLFGKKLISSYGFCSILIPIFTLTAGIFCFSAKWTLQKAVALLISPIPFFTLAIAERTARKIATTDISSVAFMKIIFLVLIAILLAVAEYLLAFIISSKIYAKKHNLKVTADNSDDNSNSDNSDDLKTDFENQSEISNSQASDDFSDQTKLSSETKNLEENDFNNSSEEISSQEVQEINQEIEENNFSNSSDEIWSLDDEGNVKTQNSQENSENIDENSENLSENLQNSTENLKNFTQESEISAKNPENSENPQNQTENSIELEENQNETKYFADPWNVTGNAAQTATKNSQDENAEKDYTQTLSSIFNKPKTKTPETSGELEENADDFNDDLDFDSIISSFEKDSIGFEENFEDDEPKNQEIHYEINFDEDDADDTFGDKADSSSVASDAYAGETETSREQTDTFGKETETYRDKAGGFSEQTGGWGEETAVFGKKSANSAEKSASSVTPSDTFASKTASSSAQSANFTNKTDAFGEESANFGEKTANLATKTEIFSSTSENSAQEANFDDIFYTDDNNLSETDDVAEQNDDEDLDNAINMALDLDEANSFANETDTDDEETETYREQTGGFSATSDGLTEHIGGFNKKTGSWGEETATSRNKVPVSQVLEENRQSQEESANQKDKTIDFSDLKNQNSQNQSSSLDEIFSKMDEDARQKVEEESVNKKSNEKSALNQNPQNQNFTEQKTAVITDENGNTKPIPLVPKKKRGPYQISTELLTKYEENPYWEIDDETKEAAKSLQETLAEFNIEAEVIAIRKGPVVTMFEILPAPGVNLNKIRSLQDNIALRLAAKSVRIVAPIPGKKAVGIEIPNKKRAVVSFRECIEENRPEWKKMQIPVVLGKDIEGTTQIMDLAKTPHLLIAGATGAGKSVCVNSMILSILYKRSPSDVKLILIDPKIVELSLYNGIGHLLTPVITEPKAAMQALNYCICEMERRYAVLKGMGCREIVGYNQKIKEQHIATEKLPYIIIVIDEFADLMATAGKQMEAAIARLAAKSRAVGIHLVLATQRPSVDVITGLIKANIPSRIAFMVASRTDSNIIIDKTGAEKLLGKGDMLYSSASDPFPIRIQGTLVSDKEVENVVNAVKDCWGEPDYIDDEIFIDDEEDESSEQTSLFNDGADDPLYEKALDIVIQAGKASASYIQRKLSIGYNRAARLVELMEERGIVGPANGSKPREIIHIP